MINENSFAITMITDGSVVDHVFQKSVLDTSTLLASATIVSALPGMRKTSIREMSNLRTPPPPLLQA